MTALFRICRSLFSALRTETSFLCSTKKNEQNRLRAENVYICICFWPLSWTFCLETSWLRFKKKNNYCVCVTVWVRGAVTPFLPHQKDTFWWGKIQGLKIKLKDERIRKSIRTIQSRGGSNNYLSSCGLVNPSEIFIKIFKFHKKYYLKYQQTIHWDILFTFYYCLQH